MRICNEPLDITFINASQQQGSEAMLPIPGERMNTLVVIFSVINPRSLNNIMLQYLPFINQTVDFSSHTLLLVGTDTKQRDTNDRKHISKEQAEQALKNLKGYAYLEMRDISEIGILLREAAQVILRSEKTLRNKNNTFLSKLFSIQKQDANHETIEYLNLKRCKLEFIPPQILHLRNTVTKLKLCNNQFKFFPDEV